MGRGLSWRRLGVLLRQLPPDCALARSMGTGGWTPTEHLLAFVADVLQEANWQRGQDEHAKHPDPVPRPGQVPAADRRLARLEAQAERFRQRSRRGEPA